VYWPRRHAQLWRYGTSIAKWGSRFLSPCDFKELGVAKGSRSTTSARSALRLPWSIIARTNFWRPQQTTMLSNRNCFKLLVKDDLRFSDCRVFLTMQIAAFRILGAGLRTVLSVTTMLRRQAAPPQPTNARSDFVFDDLASGYRTRVGPPAQRAIAQRFRALARNGHVDCNARCPLSGVIRRL
jgi:hypothetical protein